MSTVKLKNVNPLGYVDLPILRREAGPGETHGDERFEAEGVGCLIPGEVFECPAEIAERLLEQVGNYELVTDEPAKPAAAKK